MSVNNYSNNFSPSINVLILDGTDENGDSYNYINNFGKADSLCSDIINLDSYQINDKLYLSFYWNYNINGEFPDYEDSIKLEFYNKNNKKKIIKKENRLIITQKLLIVSISNCASKLDIFNSGIVAT